MTPEEARYYALAEEYATYNDLSLKAMALLANENKTNPTAMRVFSFSWQRNARHMAKAVDLFQRYFTEDGHTAKDLQALIGMAGVNKVQRDWLYTDWREGRIDSHGVLQRVADIKAPKPRRSKPDLKQRICELVQELEHDANNGAELIVKATKQAIADKLREILDAPRA
jgi:isopentenyl diphosphate isomerase/L-lactate dehydrogenase-like FMN-dependent dehydrogenase